jgi:hypothetical protein
VQVTPLLSSASTNVSPIPDQSRIEGLGEQHQTPAWFTADEDAPPGAQPKIVARPEGDRWHEGLYGIPRLYLLQNAAGQAPGQNAVTESYGGNVGGPIRKGSSHLLVDYLGLRQTVLRSLQGYVPSPSYRTSVTAAQPALASILNAYPTSWQHLGKSDDPLAPLEITLLGRQTVALDNALVRIDRTARRRALATQDATFLRFSLGFVESHAPLSGGQGYLDDLAIVRSRPYAIVAGWDRPLSTHSLQDLRVAYLRAEFDSINSGSLATPYTIVIPGLTALNGDQSSFAISNTWSVLHQLTFTRGHHTLKTGVELRRVDLNLHVSAIGRVNFASLDAFSANQVNWATFNQAVPANTLVDWQQYAWIQDDWKLRPNLLIGAGLRYEFYGRPGDADGKAIPFDFSTCGHTGFCPAGSAFNQYNPLNFEPRISAAWNPNVGPDWVRSHIVLRAGAAIYHSDGLFLDQSQPVYNEVSSYYLNSALEPGLKYPISPRLAISQFGVESAHGMSRHRPSPYATETSVSLESQLPSRVHLFTTWFAANGAHLPTATYVNLIDTALRARPHPAFGQIRFLENTSSSNLNVLAITASRYLRGGAIIMGGYNWAHEIDNDAAGDLAADVPQDPACTRCERSSGDLDVRHMGGFRSYVPIRSSGRKASQTGRLLYRLTENWSLLNDFYGSSPQPVNVTIDRAVSAVGTGYTLRQRPDRVPGVSLIPTGGRDISHWINPAAFTNVHGLYGTAPRNVARGPEMWTLSSGLQRDLLLPRRILFHVRVTGQNILNHANYAQPFADWSTPQFGQIITPYTPARQGLTGPRVFTLDLSYSR